MSRIKMFCVALMVMFSTAAVIAPAAAAQGTIVVAIDEGKILRDSKAGKDLQTKLDNIEKQMNGELEPTRASLETKGKALDAKVNGKTREAVAADAALMGELKAYQTEAGQFGQKRQKYAQDYGYTERVALIEFNKILEPVLLEVVREKNAGLVVSKSAVIYSADAIDGTASIIAKLDAKSPTVNVTRQAAPVQGQQ